MVSDWKTRQGFLGLCMLARPACPPSVTQIQLDHAGLRHRLDFARPRPLSEVVADELHPVLDRMLLRSLGRVGAVIRRRIGFEMPGLALDQLGICAGGQGPGGARALSLSFAPITGDPRLALRGQGALPNTAATPEPAAEGRHGRSWELAHGEKPGPVPASLAEVERHAESLEDQARLLRAYLNSCGQNEETRPKPSYRGKAESDLLAEPGRRIDATVH